MESSNKIWSDIRSLKDYRSFDVNKEWNAFIELTSEQEQDEDLPLKEDTSKIIPLEVKPKRRLWPGLSIAASIIALVAVYFQFFYQPETHMTVITESERMLVELSDGSMIDLAPFSSLNYPLRLDKYPERKIILNGNAQFDVVEDSLRAFVVETDETAVKVLGTIFKMDVSDSLTVVENIEGQIKFYEIDDEENGFVLNPGDIFQYDENGFKDLNEAPPQEPDPTLSLQQVLNYLMSTYEDRVYLGTMFLLGNNYNAGDSITVNLSQGLDSLMTQLDTVSRVSYDRNTPCRNCFQITFFKANR